MLCYKYPGRVSRPFPESRKPRASIATRRSSMAGSYVTVTDQDFDQQVLKSPEPVIVDYWAPWCGPCRAMAPVFEQMSVEYAGKLRFAKMNTDENPETPIKYGIQGIPTVIFFKNGREVNRMVGFGGPTALKRVIESVLAAA